jgi:hypothetical protein
MGQVTKLGRTVVAVLVLGALVAPTAPAGEYNLHALPEVGRCVFVKRGGEFRGRKCNRSEPGTGNYNWFSGPGSSKFTAHLRGFTLKSKGNIITCPAGGAEGEYTGPKNLKLPKLTMTNCKQSIIAGIESDCQNEAGSTNGELVFKELEAELAFVSHPKKLKVAWDLKPASGANLAAFECGGANETLGKSLGTGTTRELQGSVIGRVEPINKMLSEPAALFQTKRGAQEPEHLEGRPKDTLTTLVGSGKTPEATVLEAVLGLQGAEQLEVLAKCVGTGC